MPSETPSKIPLPAAFLATYTATGTRLTGNDLAIWLTVLGSAPDITTGRWAAEAAVLSAAESGRLTYTSIDVPRFHFYDGVGRLSLPRFHDAIGRLKASTCQIPATRIEGFMGPIEMLGGHRMKDAASTGSNAIEIFDVHPVVAAWAGKGKDPVATLDRADLAKLTSRYSVMLYSRWRAALVGGWSEDIHATPLDKAGWKIRVPIYMAHTFLGYDLMYAASQIQQKVLDVAAKEFSKIELHVMTDWVKAGGKIVALQIMIAPWSVDRVIRELWMSDHASKMTIAAATAVKAENEARKTAKMRAKKADWMPARKGKLATT